MKKIVFMLIAGLVYVLPSWALSVMPPYESFLFLYDQNHDKKLSLKEFLAIKPAEDLVWTFAISRESFRQLDGNRSAYLELHELVGKVGYSEKINCHIANWPRSEDKKMCSE